MNYDYLIVGSGLYGTVFAHNAKKARGGLAIGNHLEHCWEYVCRGRKGYTRSKVQHNFLNITMIFILTLLIVAGRNYIIGG